MTDAAPLFTTVIQLPISAPPVLACGAWLKNRLCLTSGNEAYLSPVIGDLSSAQARHKLNEIAGKMCCMLGVAPEMTVHDLHPDFYSTEFACTFAERYQIPALAVQHHHAHIAAICAEHQITDPVLGLALDGFGLGTDHTSWGGELLLVDGAHFHRIGHLAPIALPGGDRAAQEPWRVAAAVLAKLGRGHEITQRFSGQPAAAAVATMLQKNMNCPQTSSMGRLFDAAAGLFGVNLIQSYEAQAATCLQQLAEQHGPVKALANGYWITEENLLDFSPLLTVLADYGNLEHDVTGAAAVFHATLSAGLSEWVKLAARRNDITRLALGGGCFHNTVLLQGLMDKFDGSSVTLFAAQKLPPDDGAIALGQAWVAIQRLRNNRNQ